MTGARLALVALLPLALLAAPARADEEAAILLRWQPLRGAATYELQIAEDRGFARVVVRETVAGTQYRWRKLTRRQYFWRVRGIDPDGRKGNFSSPRPIGAVVAAPRPVAPTAGQRIAHRAEAPLVRLRWLRGGEALAQYDVQVARDAGFRDLVLARRQTATELQFRPPRPGRYHWRVGGVDLYGQTVAPGPAREFVVFVEAPLPLAPAAAAQLDWAEGGAPVRLTWERRPVRGYQVQVAADAAFRRLLARERSGRPAAVFKPPARGVFHWRVRGVEPETGWSRPRTFQVSLAAPRPLAPAPGYRMTIRGATAVVELRWQPVAGAAAYLVEVAATTAPAATPAASQAAPAGPPAISPASQAAPRRTAATAVSWAGLGPGAYAWSVRAVDAAGLASRASAPRDFVIAAHALLAAPVLGTPAAGAEILRRGAAPIQLTWSPVAGARAYDVELAAGPDFAAGTDRRRATTPATAVPLRAGWGRRVAWWRVRAEDEDGARGPWSPAARFAYRSARALQAGGPRGPAVVDVGVRVGVFYNLGAVTAARTAVQVRYRPRALGRRLGAALSVGYYTATATAPAGDAAPAVDSRLHGIPLELVVLWVEPLRVVDVYAGVGLDVAVWRARVGAATQPAWSRTGAQIGGLIVVGAERRLGPGLLFVEASFERATRSTGLVEMDPGGLSASLGYRIGIR